MLSLSYTSKICTVGGKYLSPVAKSSLSPVATVVPWNYQPSVGVVTLSSIFPALFLGPYHLYHGFYCCPNLSGDAVSLALVPSII